MARQRWESTIDGHRVRVDAVDAGLGRRVVWRIDGVAVAERTSGAERLHLAAEGEGRMEMRFTRLGRGRRATLHPPDGGAAVDLEPEPGSRAARYEERARLHPRRHEALAVAGAVAGVVLPVLLALVAVRFAISLPFPHLGLPSIPRPDLPRVPLPDLPDWSPPGWVRATLDAARYVVPVLIAWGIARAEIRRRREQDRRRNRRDDPA